jgi:hypothetical protein
MSGILYWVAIGFFIGAASAFEFGQFMLRRATAKRGR